MFEEAGGARRRAVARNLRAVAHTHSARQAAQVALGAVLRSYRFDRYRTKEKPEDKPKLSKLTVLTADVRRPRRRGSRYADGQRRVPDARPGERAGERADPAEMAERCKKLAELGLKVEVLGPKEMAKLGFGALLGVAQGSVNEPRMVVMQWNGVAATRASRRTSRSPSSARA